MVGATGRERPLGDVPGVAPSFLVLACRLGPTAATPRRPARPPRRIILFAAGWPSINAVLMSPLGRQLCGHKTRFTEDMTEYYLNDYKPK